MTDVADLAAGFGGIAEPMNVEILEVIIVLDQGWELSPRGVLTGIEPMDKNDQLVEIRVFSYPIP